MYYLVFGFVYLLSLLPFWILYRIADFAYFILFRLIGYRKEIVLQNLRHAFPGKTEAELKNIRRLFYRNFCDNWVEMLKTISITQRQVKKRIKIDYSLLHDLYKTGKSVQLFSGHFMNWEYGNFTVPKNQPYTFLGIYLPLKNKTFDRLLRYVRSRQGTVLLRAGNMREDMKAWRNKQYMIGLIADQSPGDPRNAHWLYFMNRPAGFVKRPWKKAIELNQPLVYFKISRPKRGYYDFKVIMLEENPANSTEGELALKYKNLLEADIKENPDNYLWTHRRWKRKWQPEYASLWIDPPCT